MPFRRTVNLVSTYASQSKITGPVKVFRNLAKGLDRIGQPYMVNHALDSAQWLWIHSDLRALLELPRKATLNVLGPNLVILPRDLPTHRPFPHSFYLQPSRWVAEVWGREEFNQCPLRIWPVGIDTEEIPARGGRLRNAPVLVYFKGRSPEELSYVEEILNRLSVKYRVITYGIYDQRDYFQLLGECPFLIWLGTHETQGIALQEALAMDVPILVLNALSLFETNLFPERLRSFRTTTAPYFDPRCGIILDSIDHLKEGLSLMRERLDAFRPREFVRENLSLEKQAREFVGLFEELEAQWGLKECSSSRLSNRPYAPRLLTRLRLKMFHAAKRFTKLIRKFIKDQN